MKFKLLEFYVTHEFPIRIILCIILGAVLGAIGITIMSIWFWVIVVPSAIGAGYITMKLTEIYEKNIQK